MGAVNSLQPRRLQKSNATLDRCDITGEISVGINGNSIPNECEVCNDNGVLDSTGVSNASSTHFLQDGLSDVCQLSLADLRYSVASSCSEISVSAPAFASRGVSLGVGCSGH